MFRDKTGKILDTLKKPLWKIEYEKESKVTREEILKVIKSLKKWARAYKEELCIDTITSEMGFMVEYYDLLKELNKIKKKYKE